VCPIRVLFSIDASEREHRGGPSVRAQQTAAALAALGHEVEFGERPEPGRWDVVHVFNSWPAQPSLARLEAARASGAAVVFSPIYMDHREWDYARRVLRHGFAGARLGIGSIGALRRLRRAPAEARVARSNRAIREYRALLPRMIALADHVILLSEAERAGLRELGCEPRDASRVWNAVEAGPYAHASGEPFRAEYGPSKYVLCVGRIEQRKNQALLIKALSGSGLRLVLVGRCLDPDYERLIDCLAGPDVLRIDHLAPGGALLASAFAGAEAFALASWVEGAPISALEAAAAGCPLVLGDRAGVREYFGELAHYCDPADPAAIRAAVESSIAEDSEALRMRRRSLVADQLTVAAAARDTEAAYTQARLSARRRTATGPRAGTAS
jgi:glycosyltransferase involved in cell wall biosynthesis